VVEPDDVLKWDIPADKTGPLILLAKAAEARDGGGTAICNYVLRCDVSKNYNPKSGFFYNVYDFRAIGPDGKPLPDGQLPPSGSASASTQSAPSHNQQSQAPQQPAHNTGPSPLDVFAADLRNARSIVDLTATWHRHSAALTAAGAIAEAQDMATKTKQTILLADIKAFTTAADLQANESQLLKVAGPKLAGVIGDAIKRQMAALPGEDDIPF